MALGEATKVKFTERIHRKSTSEAADSAAGATAVVDSAEAEVKEAEGMEGEGDCTRRRGQTGVGKNTEACVFRITRHTALASFEADKAYSTITSR